MPNSLEQFEAKYGKRGDGSLSYAGWDFRWEAWQAGAAAERSAIAAKFNQPHMEYFGSDIQDFLRDRSAPATDEKGRPMTYWGGMDRGIT